MKYAIFTVCAKDMSPEALLPELKRFGYDGVEWRVTQTDEALKDAPYSYWGHNRCTIQSDTVRDNALQIKSLCEGYGIDICALGTYADCTQTQDVIALLQAAALMGCPKIRVNGLAYDGSRPHDALFFASQAAFAELIPTAKALGVKMNIEMHPNRIHPSASAARRLLEPFDPSLIGVIYDIGNMVSEGYEAYKLGLEILGPYLDHVHVKNAVMTKDGCYEDGSARFKNLYTPFWEGSASFPDFAKALKDIGYNGYISLEDFCDDMSTQEKLERDIAYLRRLFG